LDRSSLSIYVFLQPPLASHYLLSILYTNNNIWKSLLLLAVMCITSTYVMAQTRPTRINNDTDEDILNQEDEDFKGFDSLQIGKDPTVPSASHPMLYTPSRVTGFHSGYREYEPYNVTVDQFKYYKTNRAISDLYFSSIANQSNLSIKTDFTRNFQDGLQLSVNYSRFSNEGFYSAQRARTTNFGTGLWYQSPKDKYNGFITFVSNVNTEEQNGGITTDTIFGTEFAQFLTSIPVNLADANTRHQQRSIRASNFYKLASPDSTNWNLQLQYDLEYTWNYWNYDDVTTNTTRDTFLYQNYLVDPRGARTYIQDNNWSQAAYIHGIGPNGYRGKVGLQYDRHKIRQAERDSTINDLSLRFDASIPFVRSLQLFTNGAFGLGMWGADATPYQFDGLFSSTQLNADIHLSLGGWHLENYIQYQILSEDIIDLPKLMSTHRLYWDGNLFRCNRCVYFSNCKT